MNLFQWIAITFLCGLLAGELFLSWRGWTRRAGTLFRCLVWLAAAVAIAVPNLVQRLADALGIQSGANVVLYLFVLAFLGASFYFYSRYVRLQRQLTLLVRHMAIREARQGREPASGEPKDND